MCCGIVSIIPSMLLLIAVVRSSLHTNCRSLMCMWIGFQLLVYATVWWLAASNMIYEQKYFKETFDANGHEALILKTYCPIWLATTCFELGISIERGLSIYNPSKYHGSAASYLLIFIYFIISV
ncbi:hypothetical protein PMAYCL1PPCAC_14934, partial [Pristionchus mayeri]